MNLLIYTERSSYSTDRVGGAETSLRLLAETLAERGHKVVYLTHPGRKRWPTWRTETVNGVQVCHLGLADLPSKGIRPLLRFRRRFDEWLFDRAVLRIVRRHNIQLVHTYHEVPGMDRLLKLRERHGLDYQCVLRIGGLYMSQKLSQKPELKPRYQYVLDRVDCLNPNTPGLFDLYRREAEKQGLRMPESEPFVHDIGIPLDRRLPRWAAASPPFSEQNPFRMVMASRFSRHQKRQDLLIEAVARLPEETPFRLTLIGDGPERDRLERQVRKAGLEGKVRIRPFMPQKELWAEMASSHLYVHACEFEGLSKIIAEAMAMGLPVLASNVTPLNDYIEDGRTGYLCSNTPESWADAILRQIREPGQAGKTGQAARMYASRKFDPQTCVETYERQFRNLLENKR